MSTTSHSTDKSSRQHSSTSADDAISLLTADHEKVKGLFEQYQQLGERAHAG